MRLGDCRALLPASPAIQAGGDREAPARPPRRILGSTGRCEETAVKVVRALKGRGVPRVDAILDDHGTPYVLEMNTIPGMTPISLLPMAANQAGLNFDELVMEILKTAQLDYE